MSRRTSTLLGCLALVAITAVAVFLFGKPDTPTPPATDAGIAIDPSATDPADVATAVVSLTDPGLLTVTVCGPEAVPEDGGF